MGRLQKSTRLTIKVVNQKTIKSWATEEIVELLEDRKKHENGIEIL